MTSLPAVIVGIDEAGRGPLAGPVAAGACYISTELFRCRRSFSAWSPLKRGANRPVIADSKALEADDREMAYTWITSNCAWGVGMVDASIIDRIGILAATEMAMHLALEQLKKIITPTFLLVDGRDAFWFDYPHTSIVRGDSLEPAIAAASIIAKVTRDRFMKEQAEQYPQYGFERHKGYGAPEHLEAIRNFGPCPLHRKTFVHGHTATNPDSSLRKPTHSISAAPSTTTAQFLQ